MKYRSIIPAIFLLAAFCFSTLSLNADTLQKIREAGVLKVGVKADYKPWGFRDPSGKLVGLELDLAADVAARLGVKLEPVVVVGSNRMQFLQRGRIDLMIATMSDKAKRREVVGILHPTYYSSGTNILTRKKYGFKKWEDLKGKQVCATQGAWYNKKIAQSYGAKIQAYKGLIPAFTAIRQNRCVAFLIDDSLINSKLSEKDKWGDYEMPLETIYGNPWGAAVRLEDKNGPFGKFVSGMIYEWHESGKLLELEKKWGIKQTDFLVQMHDRFKDWMN